MNAMTDDELIGRLDRLGDDIDRALVAERAGLDGEFVDDVLAAIGYAPTQRRSNWLIAAAIVMTVAVLGALAVPDSRRAVARWFGLDGLGVTIDPSLSRPPAVGLPDDLGPGEHRVVVVDGRDILVTVVRGALDERLITKTVGSSDQIRQVTVNGAPGLWIADAPHEVLYDVPGSDVVVERVAANTLLWNDGEMLYRVEGFDLLDDALDLARTGAIAPVDD